MRRFDTPLIAMALVAPWATATVAQPAYTPPACTQAYAAIDAAVAAQDRAALEHWGRQANRIPGCPTRDTDLARKQASRALVALADAARQAGAPASEIQARAIAALQSGRTWEALVLLGDVDFAARRFDAALQRYSEAFNEMNALLPGEPEVPVSRRAWLIQRTGEVTMIAERPAVPAESRDGGPGGLSAELLAGSNRAGMTVLAVPQPIRFEYASAVITAEGRRYTQEWLESFRGARLRPVIVTGHTDEQGDAQKDEVLAVRRAQAVAEAMRAAGFQVQAFGFARRCRIQFTAAYSPEEQNRILRRVEVLPGTALPAGYCGGTTGRAG